jgi:hypothetical protein
MRVEEMIAVRAAAPQAMRALLTVARMRAWVAPDVHVAPRTAAPVLGPGDRFTLSIVGRLEFEYLVEAVSDREVVFSYSSRLWCGRERWSFVPDGAETVVRRTYEVDDSPPLVALAWRAGGWALVSAHYKLELPRFRAEVEREPGPRGEIAGAEAQAAPNAPEPPAAPPPPPPPPREPPSPDGPPFPVDDG